MLKLKPLTINWLAVCAQIQPVMFIVPLQDHIHMLAHALDSLVRVSRRVKQNHIAIKKPHMQPTQDADR